MRKLRSLPSGSLKDQDVLERVGEMILPANDVRDPQINVIRAGGQVIGRHPVGTEQCEVFDILGKFALLAVDRIAEAHFLARTTRDPKTQREGLTRVGAPIALVPRKLTDPGVEEPCALRARLLDFACMSRREVAVRHALLKNLPRRFLVERQPLRLLVFLVPPKVEPLQSLEDRLHRGIRIALDVGVIQAKHHGPGVPSGI